jgi:hypothetical protein
MIRLPYRRWWASCITLDLLLSLTLCIGLFSGPAKAAPLDSATRARIVDKLATELAAQHAVPETGRKAARFLQGEVRRDAYRNITDGRSFAARLTADMHAASGDKHLQVFYSDTPQQWVPAPPATDEERFRRLQQARQSGSADNHGFERAELLPGNVGYLRLTRFAPPHLGGEAAHAAMTFLQNADAMIIDLRAAGGGDQAMAALLAAYLTGPEPRLLWTSRFRSGQVQQYWTPASLHPSPLPSQMGPVYLLTSQSTFSAGEYLPFVLRAIGRATIVGETTGGGAYGGHTVSLSPHYAAWISISRPVVEGVEGDWEKRGVAPHLAAPAEYALQVAQADILWRRAAALPPGAQRIELEWTAERLRAEMTPMSFSDQELHAYAAAFGERVVSSRGGRLYHRRGDGAERRLIPLGADAFALEGYDAFRLKFIRNDAGAVIALEATAPGSQPVRSARQ